MKKKLFTMLTAAAISTASLSGAALADTANFSDVEDHWAKAAIEWGVEQGAVKGYDDGTFKPDADVTEAEFLSMFLRAFASDVPVSAEDWSKPVYDLAETNNYPAIGLTEEASKDKAIIRQTVAEIIVGAAGFHLVGDDAITFLLESGYSKGKTDATIEGYKGKDNLTRGEAIQFIKAVKEKGMKELNERPRGLLTLEQVQFGKKVVAIAEELVKEHSDQKYTLETNDDYLLIKQGEKDILSWYWYSKDWGNWNEIGLYDITDAESVKLVVEGLQSIGINVPAEIAAKVAEADAKYEDIEVEVGDYVLTLLPGDVKNFMSIIISKK